MMKLKRGLTLGKFAPFHKGHQLLIETAISEMDEVVVIIYDAPNETEVPLTVRSDWIKTLYPEVKVIEAWDGPTEVGDTREIQKKHEDYILHTLDISNVSAFYSSEFYGRHMSLALCAKNRPVDPDRKQVNISASKIRERPFKYRKYIDPYVYKDLITNIVFLGAPCTGKTTISKQMAEEYHTEWMPEYGREYWEKNQKNRRLTIKQLEHIAINHLEKEKKKILKADNYLFTDTNAMTTFMFSLYYHGKASPLLHELASEASSRYDLVFLCDVDIPYDDTWDRSGDVKRKTFQKQIITDLNNRTLSYFLLYGNLEERIETVKTILSNHKKYKTASMHSNSFKRKE